MSRMVKLQRRYGSEWYLENDEGDVAWVAPMVKEHIERIEAENTKLRKELELVGHIAESNVVASIGREESLERENEKLRELVNSYADLFEKDAAMNNGCGPYYSGEDWLALANNMRIELAECCGELGIEG